MVEMCTDSHEQDRGDQDIYGYLKTGARKYLGTKKRKRSVYRAHKRGELKIDTTNYLLYRVSKSFEKQFFAELLNPLPFAGLSDIVSPDAEARISEK